MKEIIKQFCEMIDDDYKQSRSKTNTYEPWEIYEQIIESHEYQALKALLDRPIPKMEVTDKMQKQAAHAIINYENKRRKDSITEFSLTYTKEIHEWLIAMDYAKAALESVLSMPVSEDKKEEWKMPIPEVDEYDWSKLDHGLYKIYWKDGGCSMASVGSLHSGKRWFAPTNWTSKDHTIASSAWNKVKDVKCIMSNAGFDREEEPEQPTDTQSNYSEKPNCSQDNNEWIEWKGGKQPAADNTNIEVKLSNGVLDSRHAQYFMWERDFTKNYLDIIAYRIIDEPKEVIITGLKEPKKQTLLEFALKYAEQKDGSIKSLTNLGLIEMFSDYLQYLEQHLTS